MKLIIISLILYPVLFFHGCSLNSDDSIVIGNRIFSYKISPQGKNVWFIDRSTGNDYFDHGSDSWCAYIVKDGIKENVTSVSLNGKHLLLEFPGSGIMADILLKKTRNSLNFTVVKVEGDPESLVFMNIPLSLEGMPYEPFSACALSMNLYTHVRQLPPLQSHLWAAAYSEFGLEGASVTLIGTEPDNMLRYVREIVSIAEEIPFSDKGGAWALTSREGYGSYLMNFGTLTEETIEEWIKMCHNLGFTQIDNHGGGDFFRFGDFELNEQKWPEGWKTFERINSRLHEAGISSIFHTYAFFIDKNSPYVTPVPGEDLGSFRSFTLARPVREGDTEIVVNEPTNDISVTTGFFVRNSLSLRIGNEIIEFKGVSADPPYKFTGCRRGACNTVIYPHEKGEEVHHLREMFGRFVPDPESALFDSIAARTAKIVSDCNFDGIYFDAIDGSDILGGEENFWYYGTKFIFEVARRLRKPVGMEMSSMSHHWWHYRSRWQAWDRPVRGYKRFIDIHAAAIKSPRLFLTPEIKSNEYEHGLWRGHTPVIEKYAGIENGGLLLPLHLGWWGNQTWNPPQVEPTFTDDVEYLCCKMLGNNAGVSMLGGVDQKTLIDNPLFGRLVDIMRQYEELRLTGYFSDSVRLRLRQPGKEFTLIRDDRDRWNFRPVEYQKHKVEGVSHQSSKWSVENKFYTQPLKMRIELLMSVRKYNDPSAVVLADFRNPDEFACEGSSQGVTWRIEDSDEIPRGAAGAGSFSAYSQGLGKEEGLWLKMEKRFDPWLDLKDNQGLGVWVKGDGKGQLLNLRIESPRHLSHGARGDHFVKIDFTGWRYFELVEIESSGFSNYIWPDSGFYVYDSYRNTVKFESVDKLQMWFNNLPSGDTACCVIGDVKALPLVPLSISNPSLSINDAAISFPVTMESGMYLELNSSGDCTLYGQKGEVLKNIRFEGKIPDLRKGQNDLSFTCEGSGNASVRVQVTMISEGEPIIK